MFSRAVCRRCGLSAVLISVFLHNLGHKPTSLDRRESNTLSSEHIRANKKTLKPKAWLR